MSSGWGAARDGLDPAKREIALGLAGPRLDAYRVEREAAGATVGCDRWAAVPRRMSSPATGSSVSRSGTRSWRALRTRRASPPRGGGGRASTAGTSALHTATLRIDDDELVLEALEDDGALECLGECIEGGWALAWLGDATSGSPDLGGWDEDDAIEVARVIVGPREVVIASGDRANLELVSSHLEDCLRARLSRQLGLWAA